MIKDYRFKIDPIQWHEGMPLAPQHFQLNDRRYQSILNFHMLNASPYHWGVLTLNIDILALTKGNFRIQQVSGAMPDGSLIHYEESEQLPKLEVPLDAVDFKRQRTHPIFLALPVYAPNEPSAAGNNPRYISTAGDLVMDENGSFGEPTRVPRLAQNLYLIVGQVPSNKFVSFQIAEIAKEDGQHILTSFIPPLLSVSKGSSLRRTLEELALSIRSKIMYSLERYDPASDNPRQQHSREILNVLIESLLPFEATIFADGIHPFNIYLSLITVAAKLSKLKLNLSEAPAFSPYNHTNIDESFGVVIDYVNKIIASMYDKVQTRTFQKKQGYFGISLPTIWGSQKLILGVRALPDMSRSMVCRWVENALIGSKTFIQSIIDRRIVGAERRIISSDEKTVISAPNDVTLIEVNVDPHFINLGEVLYVFNPSDSADSRPMDIYHYVTMDDI